MKMQPGRRSKIVFSLDSPFPPAQWPEVSIEHQATILDLLCSFLSPIGQHLSGRIISSNGKRRRKRKRKEAPNTQSSAPSAPQQEGIHPLPSWPAITPYLTVGLNSTTRHLELLAQKAIPESLSLHRNLSFTVEKTANPPVNSVSEQEQQSTLSEPTQNPLAAVFVSRSSQPALMYAHLPLLTAAASLSHSERPPIALVPLPKGAEARLASVLGIPRVGVIGLSEGATGSTALIEFVRKNVGPVDIDYGRNGWRGTKPKALRTIVGGRSDGDTRKKQKITTDKGPIDVR